MVVKKKITHTPTVVEEASGSLEESVIQEERKTPITQVVEVIDDSTSLEETVREKTEVHDLMEHSTTTANTATVDTPVDAQETETETADEKRKELVDELFQKKSSNPVEVMPEISAHRSKKKNPIVFWAIGIVSACLVIGVSLILFSGKKLAMPSIVVVPTATPTPAPQITASPTPAEIKRDAITIQVLNGGGKAGAATKMKKALEAKGYTVKDTGNTEEYTYDKTEIHVKSIKKGYLPMLEADLKDSYTLGTSSSDLEDSVAYDVRVIVGKE